MRTADKKRVQEKLDLVIEKLMNLGDRRTGRSCLRAVRPLAFLNGILESGNGTGPRAWDCTAC